MKNYLTLETSGVTTTKDVDLENKVCILDAKILNIEYQQPKYQFWKVVGGFGAKPYLAGRAVFAKSLHDGEDSRWSREDFIGVASDELVKQYFPQLQTI